MAQEITGKAVVADIVGRWPQTIPVFIRHRMACVGCSLAAFGTLEEATRVYGLDLADFVNELDNVIQGITVDLQEGLI